MERPLDSLAAWSREHPFAVDVAIAAGLFLVTVALPAESYWPAEGVAFVLGILTTAPLAWRRRAPVPAAGVVVVAGLLQLVLVDDFPAANYAALVMVYSLAAYAPRWAGLGGLLAGLAGAVLATGRYFFQSSLQELVGDIVLAVPWLQVGAIVVVATVAGLLASVLPARRAARTSPVAAIAGCPRGDQ